MLGWRFWWYEDELYVGKVEWMNWARVNNEMSSCFERKSISLRRGGLAERTWRSLFPLFEPSPTWKEPAWARPFSLSESWARKCLDPVFFFVFGCLPHVWLDCYVKAWDEWICMSKMVYGLWMMSLAWSWRVMSMGWLVIKVTWNWYEQ